MTENSKALLDAIQEELNRQQNPSPVKYPLPCGCHGPKYISKCAMHQLEQVENDTRLAGVVDLVFTHRDFTDLPSLVKTLHDLKLRLISNPTKSCLIKVIPNETNVSSSS